MQGTVWLRYLFGQGNAIRQVAESRSAIWTGIILVLLTAFARNYDQTFIGEKPFRWFFGPLLFSFVSGTWLYLIVYGAFAREAMVDANNVKPPFWSGWQVFMALYWMTAPIAWLYAIPVERFLDPVNAAKANLCLLAIVSLWRVLLMTRVIQCLTRAPFFAVLTWVWFAAAVEVLIVVFFGGAFANAIMASMGGMRNSPAEDILLTGLGTAFTGALFTAPVALVAGVILSRRCSAEPFNAPVPAKMPLVSLGGAAVFWIAVSIYPQQELRNSATVERLIADGNSRAALDYLAKHQPADFAPARTLPPNAYEWEIFKQLPDCFAVIQSSDPEWVRRHLIKRLNEMTEHYAWPSGRKRRSLATFPKEDQLRYIAWGLQRYGPDAQGWENLLDGLNRIPDGAEWLRQNFIFVEGLQRYIDSLASTNGHQSAKEISESATWLMLSNRLHFLSTNSVSTFP